MALTKPKLSTNINTDSSVFADPILVLHQGSVVADIDVGFLMNRSNGLTANAAVIWQESSKSFVHILTDSSGAPDANLNVQSYANVSVGNVLLIANAGIYVDGALGEAGQVLASNGTKTFWAPPGAFTGGIVSGSTVFQSNLVVSNTTTSTNTTTGALVVLGGVGIVGTLHTGVLNINGAYEFPTTDGISGQVLTTNGAGIVTFANVAGGGGGVAEFSQSTVTTLPTGDYGVGEESGVGTGASATDAFEVPLGTLYDCMEPRGSIVTVDLET